MDLDSLIATLQIKTDNKLVLKVQNKEFTIKYIYLYKSVFKSNALLLKL